MAEMRSATKHSSPRLAEFASGRLTVGHATAVTKVANEFLKEALTAQARAARVLKLLCDDRAATSGHLYLVGGAGLTLASSLGSIAPTDALTQYVREFFDERMSDDVHPTLTVADEQVVSTRNARSYFRDPAGVEYRPVLMTSVGELGGPRYAGVAVLVESGRMDRPRGRGPARGCAERISHPIWRYARRRSVTAVTMVAIPPATARQVPTENQPARFWMTAGGGRGKAPCTRGCGSVEIGTRLGKNEVMFSHRRSMSRSRDRGGERCARTGDHCCSRRMATHEGVTRISMTAEVRSANGRSRPAAHGTRALLLIRPDGGGATRAMSNHVHVRS